VPDEDTEAAGQDPAAARGTETLVDPDPERAAALAERATDGAAVVTLVGRCTVDYEGRAESSLAAGERLVVCKPDGTVLVHTDEGHQPVNWQPPGSAVTVTATGEKLRMESRRSTPDERLVVCFETVQQASALALTDPAELALDGTEADLRERVLDEPSLIEPGFQPLATERETPAGAVDVYGEDAHGRTVVVELKRGRAGPDAVGQLARYVDALSRDLHAATEVRGVLVALSVTDRARRLLADRGLEFVALGPP
jgi:RecB family endonuclease NucS